ARARGWPASDTSVECQVRVRIRRDGPEVAREECWSHPKGDGMKTFLLSTTFLLAGGLLWGAEPRPTEQALARRAVVIKPAPQELRWQQIPWLTDLAEGQRLARAERRPIFLSGRGDVPLERCGGYAAGLRAGPLSDPAVIRRVTTHFVPVAVNLYKVRQVNDAGGELFRSVQRQKDQYQGLWIVSPQGKVLAGHQDFKSAKTWSQEGIDTIDAALQSFGPVSARSGTPGNPPPDPRHALHP